MAKLKQTLSRPTLVHICNMGELFSNPISPWCEVPWRVSIFRPVPKVIHSKYSKQWPYLLASTMDCDCSKMLNHGFNNGLYLSLFKIFERKYILNWTENSGLKDFRIYLIYNLICQKPANYLSAQKAVLSSFLQMFIVLAMYNFDSPAKRRESY